MRREMDLAQVHPESVFDLLLKTVSFNIDPSNLPCTFQNMPRAPVLSHFYSFFHRHNRTARPSLCLSLLY